MKQKSIEAESIAQLKSLYISHYFFFVWEESSELKKYTTFKETIKDF